MERLVSTLTTASALFAGTNLDDIVLLAVLNASSRAAWRAHCDFGFVFFREKRTLPRGGTG